MPLRTLLLVVTLLLVLSPNVSGDTITIGTYFLLNGPGTGQFTIEGFGALGLPGTLTGVTLSGVGGLTFQASASNGSTDEMGSFSADASGNISLGGVSVKSWFASCMGSVDPEDFVTCGDTAGGPFGPRVLPVAQFTGQIVRFDMSLFFNLFSDLPSISVDASGDISGTLDIEYEYDPNVTATPEPGMWALTAAGLLAFAAARRFRKR